MRCSSVQGGLAWGNCSSCAAAGPGGGAGDSSEAAKARSATERMGVFMAPAYAVGAGRASRPVLGRSMGAATLPERQHRAVQPAADPEQGDALVVPHEAALERLVQRQRQ